MIKRLIIYCFLLICISINCFGNICEKDTTITKTIYFYVNTDKIINDSIYYDYQYNVIPYLYSNLDNLQKIDIYGSVSPEGNLQRNIELTKLRANKFLQDIHIKDISKINVEYLYNDFEINNTDNYSSLRFATINLLFNKPFNNDSLVFINPIQHSIDTIYIDNCIEFIKKPIIAIKTNLLLDAILAPNIQIEWYTWIKGLSLEFEYTFPWCSNDSKHKYYQLLNGTFGIRKYLNNEYYKWYFGIYGNTGYYDFCFKDNDGYQGEHHGFGISIGYIFKNKKLKIEPYIRLGYLYSKYDKYYTSNPYINKYYYTIDNIKAFKPRNRTLSYIGPCMIGINIIYDLINIWKPKK